MRVGDCPELSLLPTSLPSFLLSPPKRRGMTSNASSRDSFGEESNMLMEVVNRDESGSHPLPIRSSPYPILHHAHFQSTTSGGGGGGGTDKKAEK